MNLVELDRALRQLRLSGMADVLEARLRHAQTERLAPLDVLSALVGDELVRRQDRLLARRHKQARFRDPNRSLDSFDFAFNKKMNRALIHELATGRFIAQHEDALFLGPPGTGTRHLAQALGRAAIHQGHTVLYDEAYALIEAIADAALDGTRKTLLTTLSTVPLLIIDDLGMRKLPHTAAEDLLEIIMRRDERASTLLTSNRPVEPSPPCWIACCIMAMSSSAGHAAGAVRLAHHGGHEVERHQSQPPCPKWPVLRCRLMAAFEVSTEASHKDQVVQTRHVVTSALLWNVRTTAQRQAA